MTGIGEVAVAAGRRRAPQEDRGPADGSQARGSAGGSEGRIAVLDVARGIAILGTLATNIWIFTDPAGIIGYLERPLPTLTGGLDQAVQAVARQLANGKFLGMLTLMFGVGLELQRRSARRQGRSWPGRYPWRATLLLLDGLLHYLLVVEFDILMGYAVTGVVVAAVLATSPRSQRAWLWAAASLHVLLISALTVALLVAGTGGDAAAADAVTLYTDGSWLDQVRERVEWFPLYRAEAVFILPLSIATFLLGTRLVRAGLFDQRGRALRRRLMIVGLVLALPADLSIGTLGGGAGLVFARYATAPLVALGLLAATACLTERRRAPGAVQRRLAEVGRAALSCYVLQNLASSVLCYGWGLGMAARMDGARTWWTLLIYAAVCTIVVTFAHLWLRRFARGPLEAAWTWAYQRPFRSDRRRRDQVLDGAIV
jgi:uncharacterized protein